MATILLEGLSWLLAPHPCAAAAGTHSNQLGDLMKIQLASAAMFAAILVPGIAAANDFPTTSRVEYVLECMKDHGGKYEYLYKCSCVIDQIASRLKYDDYAEVSTALRHQSLAGERGAEFRDPPMVRDMAKRYKAIQQAANGACFVK
jgi:hypothetical protein